MKANNMSIYDKLSMADIFVEIDKSNEVISNCEEDIQSANNTITKALRDINLHNRSIRLAMTALSKKV